MGLTQHTHAVATIQDVVNLILLIRGSIGKPGAGLCPVRGHSNVQGDRTMGIWETRCPTSGARQARRAEFGFTVPTRATAYDTVQAIRAMHAGRPRRCSSASAATSSVGHAGYAVHGPRR